MNFCLNGINKFFDLLGKTLFDQIDMGLYNSLEYFFLAICWKTVNNHVFLKGIRHGYNIEKSLGEIKC